MSPKAKVLAKFRTAELVPLGPSWRPYSYVIDMPSRRRRAGKFLGSGRTPRSAWANAARRLA